MHVICRRDAWATQRWRSMGEILADYPHFECENVLRAVRRGARLAEERHK
jgi:hypothetical protein